MECLDLSLLPGVLVEPLKTVNPVVDCEVHIRLPVGSLGCVRCRHGFGGQILGTIIPTAPANCLVFRSALNICVECAANFMNVAGNECRAGVPTPNCSYHDDGLACAMCTAAYFLQPTTKTCSLRQKASVSFCQVMYVTREGCSLCFAGYRKSADSLHCYPLVDKCITYDETLLPQGQTNICTGCAEGLYLSSLRTACLAGTVPKCLLYSQSVENSCLYYVGEAQAAAQHICAPISSPLPDCLAQVGPAECVRCNSASMLVGGRCARYVLDGVGRALANPIANCMNQTLNACSRCMDGYSIEVVSGQCCPPG